MPHAIVLVYSLLTSFPNYVHNLSILHHKGVSYSDASSYKDGFLT